ncbi:MAG: sugar kinase [Ignavibacteriae bacterium]|nr:sugar kinase [Ignavibacteriota bacterium]MCB9206592.1 sugar kinase [Ignavibacteriales bacterium]MCB9209680.1 sugar kinase [Ignavibacteriales bacterium]
MDLLVVGSVGLDDVETPFGKVESALGGAATYISLSASYFTKPVKLIGVVGEDFPQQHIDMLENHMVELDNLEIVRGGKTFRWGGRYHYDLNVRDTLFTKLNVFEKFNPQIPDNFKKNSFIILGNIIPSLQLSVINQLEGDNFIVTDTMNLWIETTHSDLIKVLEKTNALIINDSEARLLSKEANLIKAARIIREMGPEYLIIKKGEHGALLFNGSTVFSAPAYPLESIFDPTGAGDTFLGGFAGYLHNAGEINFDNVKRAVIYGSAMASFCVEQFSTKGLEDLDKLQIHDRFLEFRELSRFDYE